jgi:hypothetical protein
VSLRLCFEMVKSILVFVPDSLHLNKSGYLEGLHKEYDECEAYYITNDSSVKETTHAVGYLSNDVTKTKTRDTKAVHIDNLTTKISLVNYGNLSASNVVKIEYDYHAFCNCDGLNEEHQYGVHFKFLSNNLRKRRRKSADNGRKSASIKLFTFIIAVLDWSLSIFNATRLMWAYSATISHFYNNLTGYKWFFTEIMREKRVSPKVGNFLLSKIFDLLLGIILLDLFMENEDVIVNLIENVRETIIYGFRDLLIYLMGSPIGLKLNYAFNKSLGTFFFYHISLWRIFLITMQPYVKEYFKLLVLPGAFGFSYQVAMLSDLVSIATFHVYCIYVYAAR